MTLLKKYKYKYNTTIDLDHNRNPYFVDNLIRILCEVESECTTTGNFTLLQSTFSSRLDKFVKENLIPKLK